MSGILYHNEDSTVFLLDIPTSIAEAQGRHGDENKHLISSEPLEHPFRTPEPRLKRARANILDREARDDLHREFSSSIQTALMLINKSHGGDWCLPRRVAPRVSPGKRTASAAGLQHAEANEQAEVTGTDCVPARDAGAALDDILKALSTKTEQPFGTVGPPPPHIAYQAICNQPNPDADNATQSARDGVLSAGVVVQNPGDQVIVATVSAGADFRFLLPPDSMAIVAKCDNSSPLREALRTLVPSGSTSQGHDRKFNMILLDPPWPNRSARRKGSYETQYSRRDTEMLLYGMDLDIHLAAGSYVAIWITNKAAVRDLVLGCDGRGGGGWFGSLGVELVEEWLWIKTTRHGEPICDLHGVWRKPYEVLLVGKQSNALPMLAANSQPAQVKRRVIAAVPDLHSRKPCLKRVFGELLFGHCQFRALEIFARCMIGGWCSWGDEVIKYNYEAHWC